MVNGLAVDTTENCAALVRELGLQPGPEELLDCRPVGFRVGLKIMGTGESPCGRGANGQTAKTQIKFVTR